ncbi:Cof-type HAD-IIB family hydrolase [Lactobacillus hamsteri]|uniref:Sugar-phosphatase n=1 Tax=Lactobacillus hamsteri DSM 5661 = JCM 6256 TaxID=1423754 RepID=A0A0R1YDW0_9LACO|nr:Cof-type HAD-IIB family hydrolase [Lactobacillus hamsteri]KRM40197.1 hypothetical protein FC39_GL000811 [Lactobacillus hamsteri DSM 5661 = JCM 6256]
MADIPFKAIAVDMDGTFMTDDLTFDHDRFKKLLKKIKENHIHFIVSSGRPLARLRNDFAEFLDEIDIIADNGAILVRDNNIISSHFLTHKTGLELINFIETKYPSAHICVSGKNASYFKNSSPTSFKRLMHFYYPNFIEINSFDEMPSDERVIKLTLNCPAKWAEDLEKEFNDAHSEHIHCTTSGFDDIDIVPYGINKAQALKYFLRYFKVAPSELIAFGDGLNDKEMIELAGYSYAMGNGDERIKEIAKYEAPSNNESGVLQVLEKYFA